MTARAGPGRRDTKLSKHSPQLHSAGGAATVEGHVADPEDMEHEMAT